MKDLIDAGAMMSDKGYSIGNEADQKAFSDARNYPLPNKKINDLAEHCDFYVGNEHYDKTHEQQQRLFMEKFAELFLLESIEVMTRYDYHGQWLGEKLKEHWGITHGK
jgi:hypothetical protein